MSLYEFSWRRALRQRMSAGGLFSAQPAGTSACGGAAQQSFVLAPLETLWRTGAGPDLTEHIVQPFWRTPGPDSTRCDAQLLRFGTGRADHRQIRFVQGYDALVFRYSANR